MQIFINFLICVINQKSKITITSSHTISHKHENCKTTRN